MLLRLLTARLGPYRRMIALVVLLQLIRSLATLHLRDGAYARLHAAQFAAAGPLCEPRCVT